MITFLPQSFVVALQSFGIAAAGIVMLLSAIVTAGMWESLRQELKLKRVERERRRMEGAG
jgi:hypothetical protein